MRGTVRTASKHSSPWLQQLLIVIDFFISGIPTKIGLMKQRFRGFGRFCRTHRLVGNSTHEFFQYLHELGYVMFHKVCKSLLMLGVRRKSTARNLTFF
jgi:hypothetical protein